MGLAENVKVTIDGMGQIELSGIRLESADSKLLDVGSLDLDKHVAMQPAAIAYYGAMRKEASRRFAALKRGYERWEKKQWALAKAAVMSGTTAQWKPTLDDIKSRFIADNERELEGWDGRLDKAEEEADTLDAWYEAWRQKSFALRDHASIDADERWNASGSMGGGDNGARYESPDGKPLSSDRIREVRDIMRKRRVQS
jgi:hypothetical protein